MIDYNRWHNDIFYAKKNLILFKLKYSSLTVSQYDLLFFVDLNYQ